MKRFLPVACAPTSYRLVERQKKVLKAAQRLFATRGFEHTQIAQISTKSGVQVGQIYRDFESKEQIVVEVVRADLAAILSEPALEEAEKGGDAQAVHRWMVDLIRCADPMEGHLLAHITAEATRNERIAALFQHANRRISAALMRGIAVIAPAAEEAEKAEVVEILVALLFALPQRRIAAPDTGTAELSACFIGLLKRELVRLADQAV